MRVRWKNFELPMRVTLDDKTATTTYGCFFAEPFERGMGTTIGNSLRRILYSSIEGTAVTSLKIKGVAHEFSTVKGVVEDVPDIILNLKQLLVRLDGDSPKKLLLEVDKKGPVKADQITPEAGVEILNPDLVICTLVDNIDFSAEIEVRKGRRYVTAEEHGKDFKETGIIYVDSSFSPVKKVRYKVENTRVGKLTNYDKLILEIWTNGIVTPDYTLVEASKILRKHLNPFVFRYEIGRELQVNEKKEEEMRKQEKYKEDLRQKLSMSVSELDLSVRASNCLSSEKVETIGELVSRSEQDLLKIRNFGKTSLREVRKKLQEMNLSLGINVEEITGKKGT